MTTQVTFLDDAIDDRVIPMLTEVSALFTPPVRQVTKFVDPRLAPPFWWVYPGQVTLANLAPRVQGQVYAVNMRLVIGYSTTGYQGQLESALWVWLPTVIRYFRERKRLVFQDGQNEPQYLDPSTDAVLELIAPFTTFEDSNHIGVEFQLVIPFTVSVTPFPGN